MKIYKKCPCCGKTIFLMLGSDFGNEVEFGSAFGNKDNIPHSDISHEQDWDCLTKFLSCLKTSHGKVFISLKNKERDNLPKEILKWTENYKEEAKKSEEKEKDKYWILNYWTKWKNISCDFTETLVKEWIEYGFTYDTCADWINIGFKPTEADYAYWLEKEVDFEPLKYLNETSSEDQANLRKQFKEHLTI